MSKSKRKGNPSISRFILFNVIFPIVDVATDVKSFLFYFLLLHFNWAYLTLTWVGVPFAIHLAKFLYELFNGKAGWKEFGDVFLHIPFILPLRNLYFALVLYFKYGFGRDDFDPKNWPEVEKIQHQVAKDGLSESYFESGPGCHKLCHHYLNNILFRNFGRIQTRISLVPEILSTVGRQDVFRPTLDETMLSFVHEMKPSFVRLWMKENCVTSRAGQEETPIPQTLEERKVNFHLSSQ